MADVTERLTNVLNDLDELSESDVSAVAQVVDHIVAVKRPPTQVLRRRSSYVEAYRKF